MEEISLKEIIQSLLKGKFIIIIATVTALVIGAAVYLLMPDKYKTTVSILANPIVNIDNAGNNALNSFALPNMDISVYQQQFLSNYVVGKTIVEMELRDRKGDYVTPDYFKEKMVIVTNPEKTNILDVEVLGRDPEQVVQIAGALVKHFIGYITEIYQTSAGVSAEALEEQLKTEEAKLDKEAARLRDYLVNSDNIDAMSTEISSLIAQITRYKENLNDLGRAIAADSVSVTQIKERVGDVPQVGDLELSADITSRTSYTGDYQLSLGTGTADLESTLFTLKLADIEVRLIENTNNRHIVEQKVDELQSKLSELQAKQAEEQYKYNAIQRDFGRAENVYNAYTEQYQKALIVKAAHLGDVNIKTISEAIVPVDPYNKSVILIGGIAGVFGVFLGVFIVLFKGYWTSDDVKSEAIRS